MKIFLILSSFIIIASGAILSEVTKLTNAFGRSVAVLNEDVMELQAKLFYTEIELWLKLGYQTRHLKGMIKDLAFPISFQKSKLRSLPNRVSSTVKCIVCRSIAKTVIKFKQSGVDENTIMRTISNLCTQLNVASKSVCEGVIRLNMPIIFYIIDHKHNMTSRDFCGVVLQSDSCAPTSDEFEWTIELDTSQPQDIQYEETLETFNIIQLSDIHYDSKYEPYGNPLCKEPTCCRQGQNNTNESGQVAGYWGDYNDCDTPWHSVVDVFTHVKNNNEETDVIYFTGDIIDHGVWETTQNFNAENILKIYKALKLQFPTKKIFPILGNHEPNPVNIFAPSNIANEKFSTKWLYQLLADMWISFGWLPESTRSTILKGGFYTVAPKKGFRIIALNNNVCYTFNWWILYEPRDPDDQLNWLANTLLLAEKQKEFVHILAHIPPGSDECLRSWSKTYRKIINRFSHIIAAEFNGHTHNDEIRVFYKLENRDDAINVAWNGGSITTYTKLNPNYKVYSVNHNNYYVENVKTWIYNLTEANLTPEQNPKWFVSYSFKEEYGLKNLSMSSLNNWLKGLCRNETIALQYYLNSIKRADPLMKETCDKKCIESTICTIVTTDMSDNEDCERFKALMQNQIMDSLKYF